MEDKRIFLGGQGLAGGHVDTDSGEPEDPDVCGGFAPIVANCTTGIHSTGWYVNHVIVLPSCGSSMGLEAVHIPCYAGVAESRLIWPTVVSVLRCRILAFPKELDNECVAFTSGWGPFVPEVRHECSSYYYLPPEAMQPLMEGGVGEWRCAILHS